jgi:rod shape-determining protein MreC
MQQIFSFIIKNSNRILFLLLLGISLSLTIQSHSFHRSKIISSANFLSGGVYEKINSLDEYLHLREQNDQLAIENANLKSLLFKTQDSAEIPNLDSLKGVLPKDIVVCKVIHNSYNVVENFLTLNAGAKQGVKPDMGVINSLGIVGITDDVSENFATVISILNTKSQINAKIKHSDHFGTLNWDGKNTGFVQLIDVPRLATIKKGDTIVTGGQSVIFPENIGIGTIDNIYIPADKTHYFTINVRLFNDMTNLGHVYIIKTENSEEIKNLENQRKDE